MFMLLCASPSVSRSDFIVVHAGDSGSGSPPNGAAATPAAAAAVVPHISGVFAVHEKGRQLPRLLSSGSRDALLGVVQTQASRRLGLDLLGASLEQHWHTCIGTDIE
jgi:hypothetical protein